MFPITRAFLPEPYEKTRNLTGKLPSAFVNMFSWNYYQNIQFFIINDSNCATVVLETIKILVNFEHQSNVNTTTWLPFSPFRSCIGMFIATKSSEPLAGSSYLRAHQIFATQIWGHGRIFWNPYEPHFGYADSVAFCASSCTHNSHPEVLPALETERYTKTFLQGRK